MSASWIVKALNLKAVNLKAVNLKAVNLKAAARPSVVATVACVAVSGSASAALVASNARVDVLGAYSDAFSSGGYTYGQSGAQAFSLEDATAVESIRFWGSSNGFAGQGIDNIDAFELRVWNADFTAVVYQATIAADAVVRSATGIDNLYNQPEFAFDLAHGFTLAAGDYRLNIGAVLADAAGDQFVWSVGANELGFYYTAGEPFGPWRQYTPGVNNTAGGAFEMFGETVPAPGAFALLLSAAAIAGRGSRRRR